MHFSSILPVFTLIVGLTSANPIDDDPILETRDNSGIDLIKLDLKKGKSYNGVGKPGECYKLPWNVKNFDGDSDETKSYVSCFECRVYYTPNCKGSYFGIGGQEEAKAFDAKGGKKPHYKSWKCKCKDEW
jgi:hypothetical protein